jgi:hypothetical protein
VIPAVPAPFHPFRAAYDVERAALSALRIVHVGQSSALLEAHTPAGPRAGSLARPASLVPVTWSDRGLAPGGFAVADADGLRVRRQLLAADPGFPLLDLSGWVAALGVTSVDLRMTPLKIDPAATGRLALLLATGDEPGRVDPAMDACVQRALAPALADAVVHGHEARVRQLALRLVGAGPGATPAGDDVLIGALAALHAADGAGAAADRAHRGRSALATVVADGLARTTAASRHDLAAALRGSFAERAHRMTAAITDVHAVEPAYDAALGWGATSGVDFLHGLARTAEALLGRRWNQRPAVA